MKRILRKVFRARTNFEIIDSNKNPIKIHNPSKNSTFCLNYCPDFIARHRRSGKDIIVEILDTQGTEKTIADVIRCILYDRCIKARFITKDITSAYQTDNLVQVFRQHIRRSTKRKIVDITTVDGNPSKYGPAKIIAQLERIIDLRGQRFVR